MAPAVTGESGAPFWVSDTIAQDYRRRRERRGKCISKMFCELYRRMGTIFTSTGRLGRTPTSTLKGFAPNSSPVVFDVGANVGQTIDALRQIFPRPTIYALEPDKAAFDSLLQTHSKLPHVHLNCLALGSKPGRQIFFENSLSVMSSFLPLGRMVGGRLAISERLRFLPLTGTAHSMKSDLSIYLNRISRALIWRSLRARKNCSMLEKFA